MAVTQKEIAELLGVSRVTVSLALRDSTEISRATKEKVKKAAKALHYYPSDVARSLSTGISKTIGIVIPALTPTFFVELLDRVLRKLSEHGYSWLILTVENRDPHEVVESLLRKKVDGVIAIGKDITEQLQESGILFVTNSMEDDCDYVATDYYQGASRMMEHLVGIGYRKIGFLCSFDKAEFRFQGYNDALLKHGLPYREEWVIGGAGFFEDGLKGMKRLLSLAEPPEAVFAMNDLSAIGAMRAVKEAGLNVPGDMAITGFDNITESRYLQVALTTFAQDKGDIARHLVETLLRKLENRDEKEPCHIRVEGELIIRESCGYYAMKRKEKQPKKGGR